MCITFSMNLYILTWKYPLMNKFNFASTLSQNFPQSAWRETQLCSLTYLWLLVIYSQEDPCRWPMKLLLLLVDSILLSPPSSFQSVLPYPHFHSASMLSKGHTNTAITRINFPGCLPHTYSPTYVCTHAICLLLVEYHPVTLQTIF